jgi:aldehyde dehydrogenase (NAD+)
VFADADWDAAPTSVVNAIVQNAGQTCSAGSRVLVGRKIWDRFMADLSTPSPRSERGRPKWTSNSGR